MPNCEMLHCADQGQRRRCVEPAASMRLRCSGGGLGVLEGREAGERERASACMERPLRLCTSSPRPRQRPLAMATRRRLQRRHRPERSAILSKSRCPGWGSESPYGLALADGIENRTCGRDLPTPLPLARPNCSCPLNLPLQASPGLLSQHRALLPRRSLRCTVFICTIAPAACRSLLPQNPAHAR